MNGPRKYLVINADDLGYNEERDRGIFECFLDQRSISSASILANGVFSQEAAKHAKEISLPVGLHFNISEGKPVSACQDIKSLVDDTGCFLGKLGCRVAIEKGILIQDEVKTELHAQIKWFQKEFSKLPTHVDGHQHVHVLPIIRDAFQETLKDWGIKWTRVPVEENIEAYDFPEVSEVFLKSVVKAGESCREFFSEKNLSYTRIFIGLSCTGTNMSVERIEKLLKTSYNRTNAVSCEFMVHPGYPCLNKGGCGIGPDEFSKSKDRGHEMQVLRNPELKQFYENENIKIVSFEDLNQMQVSLV